MNSQDWYCQGLSVSVASILRMVEAEIAVTMLQLTTSPARSGQLHRGSSTPVSAGSWQASALISVTCTG
jgi:hypothetical protein